MEPRQSTSLNRSGDWLSSYVEWLEDLYVLAYPFHSAAE